MYAQNTLHLFHKKPLLAPQILLGIPHSGSAEDEKYAKKGNFPANTKKQGQLTADANKHPSKGGRTTMYKKHKSMMSGAAMGMLAGSALGL